MFVKLLLEWSLWIILLVLGTTQVLWPIFRRQPLFPLFRRRKKLEGEIVELNEQIKEEKLEGEAEVLRKQLEQLRTPPSCCTHEEKKQ